MEGTGTTGVGRCFVKAFLCYDSILRQEFDKGHQTLPNLKKLHASATSTALAELEKLHDNCEQHPEALKQHRMQLLNHVENAFEARRRKVEQTLWENKQKKTTEWEKLEEIGALIRQNPQDFGLHQPTLADYQIQHDVIPDRTSAGTGDKEKTEVRNDSLAESTTSQKLEAELSKQKEKYESALKVLSKELEQVKQQNAKLLKEKENMANTTQAQLEAQRQHYETLMQTQSEVQKQHYKELVKSHLEKISQLEQELDQEANRRKAESEKLKAEVELYRENVQSMKTVLENTMKTNQELSEQHREQRQHNEQNEAALRAKENELRQLRDQQRRKEEELKAQKDKLSGMQQQNEAVLRAKENELRQVRDQQRRKEEELKAQKDKLSEMQQRINRCRTRRLEILNEVRQITNEMFDRLKRGLPMATRSFIGGIFAVPTPNELKATFQRLADLLEELKSLDD